MPLTINLDVHYKKLSLLLFSLSPLILFSLLSPLRPHSPRLLQLLSLGLGASFMRHFSNLPPPPITALPPLDPVISPYPGCAVQLLVPRRLQLLELILSLHSHAFGGPPTFHSRALSLFSRRMFAHLTHTGMCGPVTPSLPDSLMAFTAPFPIPVSSGRIRSSHAIISALIRLYCAPLLWLNTLDQSFRRRCTGCSASHEAYDVAVTWQCNRQGSDIWKLAADSSEMASGVLREANEALKSNNKTAQGPSGENYAFMQEAGDRWLHSSQSSDELGRLLIRWGHLRRLGGRYAAVSETLMLIGFEFMRPLCRQRPCTACCSPFFNGCGIYAGPSRSSFSAAVLTTTYKVALTREADCHTEMASSCSTSLLAPSFPLKIVPYVSLLHIDDFPMPDLNALGSLNLRVSALFRAADASVASVPPPNYDSSVAKTNSALNGLFDRSSLEFPLILESDAAEEHHSTTQHNNLNKAGMRALSVEGIDSICHKLSPAEDKLLFNVEVISRLPSTRKQTRRSSGDTMISLTEVPDITSEPELEDPCLLKQRRPSVRQAESLILDHVPTPKPTPLPTPSSLDSRSRAGSEPSPDPLDSDSKSSRARSPVPPLNNLGEENGDDGAHSRGRVEELLHSPRQSISPREGIEAEQNMDPDSERYKKRREGSDGKVGESREDGVALQRRALDDVNAAIVTGLEHNANEGIATSHRDWVLLPANILFENEGWRLNQHQLWTQRQHVLSDNRSHALPSIVHCNESILFLNPTALDHKLFGEDGKVIRMAQLSPDSLTLPNPDRTSSPYSDTDYPEDDVDEGDENEEEDTGECKPHAAGSNQGFRTNASDEERLLSYKDKMSMDWDQVVSRFPDRSEVSLRRVSLVTLRTLGKSPTLIPFPVPASALAPLPRPRFDPARVVVQGVTLYPKNPPCQLFRKQNVTTTVSSRYNNVAFPGFYIVISDYRYNERYFGEKTRIGAQETPSQRPLCGVLGIVITRRGKDVVAYAKTSGAAQPPTKGWSALYESRKNVWRANSYWVP
ncbi:uncharacterized protein BDR25DRAFT_353166 [Lindgomyces ingoldianus]|uniref:Uncharacterized protein n=1 Tax=Lindgomyces ingoldianus TaxID=673940 RepID=A0ACB6R184_9PLEO|nr:uncharacterized protein BDR25DRAFT_353166 [Lindgomyces ingoldianus]KAF2472845.1 hypothetical protein BDR25DRAFT_353166 [Lindgomyces ingoldianus]